MSQEEKKELKGYWFSKKQFTTIRDVKKWADDNAKISGMVFERGNEMYFGYPGLDESASTISDVENADGVKAIYAATQGKPFPDNPEPPEAVPLYGIESAEIFREGTWTDAYGRTTKYEAKDIDDMVKSQRKNGVPSKLGHWGESGAPAAGTVVNLVHSGKSLLGDIINIPQDVYKLMIEQRYPFRSAEIVSDEKDRYQLIGLALLGSEAPALDLKPIAYSQHNSSDGIYSYIYKVDEKTGEISQYNHENVGGDNKKMSDKLIEKIEQENAELKSRVSKFEAEKSEAAIKFDAYAAKNDELSKEIETLKSDIAARDGEIDGYKQVAYNAEKSAWFEKVAKKFMPSDRQNYEDLYDMKAGGENDAFSTWKKSIESRADHSALAESSTGDNTGDDDAGDVSDFDAYLNKIVNYCAKNGLDHTDVNDYMAAEDALGIDTKLFLEPAKNGVK